MSEYIQFTNFGYIKSTISDSLLKKLKHIDRSQLVQYKTELSDSYSSCVPHFHMPDEIDTMLIEEVDKMFIHHLNQNPDIRLCIERQGNLSSGLPLGYEKPWMNIFESDIHHLPNHDHYSLYNYNIYVTLPESSSIQFSYNSTIGMNMNQIIELTPDNEGEIYMFPGPIMHSVPPYYHEGQERISVVGNMKFAVEGK